MPICSRKDIDKLTESARSYGAKGLVWIRVNEDEINSSVNKFFDQEQLKEIAAVFEAKAGDLILIVSDRAKVVFDTLGFLRREIAGRMGLLDDKEYKLLWVVDFPLFEKDDETGELKAMHHPFTSPKPEDIPMLDSAPKKSKPTLMTSCSTEWSWAAVPSGYTTGSSSPRCSTYWG